METLLMLISPEVKTVLVFIPLIIIGAALMNYKELQRSLSFKRDRKKQPLNEDFSYDGRIDSELTLKSLEVDNPFFEQLLLAYKESMQGFSDITGKRTFIEDEIEEINNDYRKAPIPDAYKVATETEAADFYPDAYVYHSFKLSAKRRNDSITELMNSVKGDYLTVLPPHPSPREFEEQIILRFKKGVSIFLYYSFLRKELAALDAPDKVENILPITTTANKIETSAKELKLSNLQHNAFLLLHHYLGIVDPSKKISESNSKYIADKHNLNAASLRNYIKDFPPIPLLDNVHHNTRGHYIKHYESILPILEKESPKAFELASKDYEKLNPPK